MLISRSIKFNFLLFAFITPLCIRAMEQEASPFDSISTKMKQHTMLIGISSCKDLKEVALFVAQVKLINTEWNNLIEDPVIVSSCVKNLHKKFNIKKLDARYILHTKPALEQLQTRTAIITKYAFLHHNDLLQENGGIKSLTGGELLTRVALNFAHQDLCKQKKNNQNFESIIEIVKEDYFEATKEDLIDVVVNAYGEDKIGGHTTSARLLYLSENIHTALNTIKLKEFSISNNLFIPLALHAFEVFYPTCRGISSIGKQMMLRIKPIGMLG